MLDALAEFFPPEAEWTQPGGGLFIWATLPDFIDTEDLLAKAIQQEDVAFVPGSAAYVDGRGGSSMRLNFSAVSENDIVEGIRRIGKVIDAQISLYGTISREHVRRSASRSTDSGQDDRAESRPLKDKRSNVVPLPRRPSDSKRGARGS
jgi:2-aminoadipate transaminase